MPNSFGFGSEKLILVFLGKAGTGKGTQAQLLAKETGILHVSMGDIVREEVAKKTALGKQISEIINAGNLVPDDLTAEMLDSWLEGRIPKQGIIFDGFPRTAEQCGMLEELLDKRNLKVDLALNFTVPEKELIKRLSNRRTCKVCKKVYNLLTFSPKKAGVCDLDSGELYQRDDDKEEAIKERFACYEQQIKPILEFYKGKVIEIDSSKSIEQVNRKVREIVKAY